MQQWVFSLWSVHGLYSRAATGTAVGWLRQLVSNGKGRHKSWLQSWSRSLQRYSELVSYELVTWTVPVTSEYSGRAAVFREELHLQ
jgi:hypothetical protein